MNSIEKIAAETFSYRLSRAHKPEFEKPRKAEGFLPIIVHGGIGDLIVATSVIEKIKEFIPVQIYPNHRAFYAHFYDPQDLAPDEPFPGFDHWLSLETMPRFRFSEKFKSFKDSYVEKLYLATKSSETAIGRAVHYQPQLDYEIGKYAIANDLKRYQIQHWALGYPTLDPRPKLSLPEPVYTDLGRYITVHDGVDVTQTNIPYRATKCWSLKEWGRLTKGIKYHYPNVMIVQLGGPTSRPIPGVDINFAGKLRLEQSIGVLKSSLCHIDGDSGLIHAATAMDVPCAVLFGPTPSEFFGYPQNYNFSPTKCKEDDVTDEKFAGCWWSTSDYWLRQCARGGAPTCMDSIHPGRVLEAIREELDAS